MFPVTSYNALGRLPYGQVLYNRNDEYIGRSIEMYGEYSAVETTAFDQVVGENQIVVDAGANIGVHTLFLARKVGPAGRVLAFEPQRLMFQTLCGNLALNSITNTYCWNMALGETPGETVVPCLDPTVPHNFGGVSLDAGGEGEPVAVTTIDNFHLPRCDFIKIDVEGMEEQVLRGAEQTIRRFKPILYLECDRVEKEASLIRCLDAFGYQMFWHLPPLFNPANFNDNPENVFGDIVSRNMLCFDKAREHELTGFEPVHVPKAA
ncbi:MAG: FkbM family methyltransferase [Planctomycetaceae bacterium]